MVTVQRVVRRASIRLWLFRFVRGLVLALSAAVIALLLVRLAERLAAVTVDWSAAWIASLAIAALAAAAWTIITRERAMHAARAVDEGASLREALSTALFVEGRQDAWSRAAVGHAEEISRRVLVRQAIPFQTPRLWFVPLVGAGLFLAMGLIPQQDLLASLNKEARAEEQQRQETAQAHADVEEAKTKLDEVLSKVDDGEARAELEELQKPKEASNPEEVRRAAIKQLTQLQDRLNDLKAGEKSAMLEELRGRMEQLRQPRGGSQELNSLVQNLQKGDFQKANEALSELMEKAASSELTEEQKQQLADQLKKLAEQMEKLAEQQDDLERKLKEAGLDEKLALDPEALKKALENAQNLTEEQKQQLQQMAQAAQKACKACQGMAGACSAAAGAMAGGEMGEDGLSGSLGDLRDELSALEMAQCELEAIDAALSECKGQIQSLSQCLGQCSGMGLCESDMAAMGLFRPGASNKRSPGSGGPGIGSGQAPGAEEAAFNLEKKKSKSHREAGPIVGSMLIQGEQVRGESVAEFSSAVRVASEAAAEAIENKQVPREFHEALKHYFGRLEKSSKSKTEQGEADDASGS